MDFLELKCCWVTLIHLAYKFRLNQRYYYGPVLVFVSTRADSDRIGANELIDSHASIAPAKYKRNRGLKKRTRQTIFFLSNVENIHEYVTLLC